MSKSDHSISRRRETFGRRQPRPTRRREGTRAVVVRNAVLEQGV